MKKKQSFSSIFVDELCRMSTAVFFVSGLAFVSVAGTLLEQNLQQDDYLASLGPFWLEIYSTLGLFNVFSTPWFLAVLFFTLLSVCACLWKNSGHYWSMFAKVRMPSDVQLSLWKSVPVADVDAQHLTKKGYVLKKEEGDKSLYIRGKWNRLGYHFMHVGLVVMMVAGLLTGLFGYRDMIVLADGMSTDRVFHRNIDGSLTPRMLPFTLKSNKFYMETYDTGMPSAFYTDVEITEKNGNVIRETVVVNKPVSVGKVMIYQSSYGDAGSEVTVKIHPLMPLEIGTKTVQGTFRLNKPVDLGNGYTFTLLAVEDHSVESLPHTAGEVDKLEDRGPHVDYEITSPTASPMRLRSYMNYPDMLAPLDAEGQAMPVYLGVNMDDVAAMQALASVAQLDKRTPVVERIAKKSSQYIKSLDENERAQSALNLLQAVKVFDQLDVPCVLSLEDYNKHYYSLLQVSEDPGMLAFCVASFLMLVGVFLMIYMRYARIVVCRKKDVVLFYIQGDDALLSYLKTIS